MLYGRDAVCALGKLHLTYLVIMLSLAFYICRRIDWDEKARV